MCTVKKCTNVFPKKGNKTFITATLSYSLSWIEIQFSVKSAKRSWVLCWRLVLVFCNESVARGWPGLAGQITVISAPLTPAPAWSDEDEMDTSTYRVMSDSILGEFSIKKNAKIEKMNWNEEFLIASTHSRGASVALWAALYWLRLYLGIIRGISPHLTPSPRLLFSDLDILNTRTEVNTNSPTLRQ